MGVPGLFANLHHKYKSKIIKKKLNGSLNLTNNLININPHILYFDFNCLIHPICHLLWSEFKDKNISNENFENKMIVKSIEYMEKVIEYANPTKVGIYIDGVCPISKMVQQRQRRFASILDKEIMNNIRFKNNVAKEEYYDTNAITPGTNFMAKLDEYITSYVRNNKKIEIEYSSYMAQGEGEHKIIMHIKENKNELQNKNIVIYGLDADLIILSLTLTKDFNIMLLREEEHVSFDNFNLIFFDVNECANCLIQELTIDEKSLEYGLNLDAETIKTRLNIIDDFIFITILLGNDFIPPNPTLNMRFRNKGTHGYEILMNEYKRLLFDSKEHDNFNYIVKWIDKQLTINWYMFIELINRLATSEEHYFENAKIFYNNKLNAKNRAEEQIYHLENMMFSHPNPLMMQNKYIDYNIRKSRFIHHYFGNKVAKCSLNKQQFQSQLLSSNIKLTNDFYNDKVININVKEYDKVITEYLKTISYVMYYYYHGCPDNMYYYKQINGILLSDLYEYLNRNILNLDKVMNEYSNKTVNLLIHPLEQLLMVLPIKSQYLLPKSIEKFVSSNNDDKILISFIKLYFPKIIKRDFLNKSKLFQATLILDIPPLEIIRALIIDKKITQDEANRSLIIKH